LSRKIAVAPGKLVATSASSRSAQLVRLAMVVLMLSGLLPGRGTLHGANVVFTALVFCVGESGIVNTNLEFHTVRLLASTDLALRVLILLGREPDGQHLSVDALARALGGLSRHHLHKIVQDLTGLGVTRTVRGAGGGVRLAMPPDQIRLGTVVRQLEGEQVLVECFRPEGCSCTLAPGCRLRGMLKDAKQSFYDTLDRNTLADCLPMVA
jgi:Rrf2 family nitric oxide-sensitive transcriptional repressor